MPIPDNLGSGYRQFRGKRFFTRNVQKLAKDQRPHTMVIGCADSRVDPTTIFSSAPGELFVVRNIAALVPPYEETAGYHGTSAAIEFAVTSLKIQRIVVLGHGLCGGVEASLTAVEDRANDRPVGRFIGPWVELIADVRDEMLKQQPGLNTDSRQRILEHLAIRLSLDNLMTFPFVRSAVEEGALELEGGWFSIVEARLEWLNHDNGTFEPVDAS